MEKVVLSDKVKIVGTGKSAFMPKGTMYEVHPSHAKTLINEGKAMYAKPGKD